MRVVLKKENRNGLSLVLNRVADGIGRRKEGSLFLGVMRKLIGVKLVM